MQQILQSFRNGATTVAEVPCPGSSRQHVAIRTRASLISAGTERMLLEFGKANFIQKARQQPDKVRQVLEKVRTDGFAATLDSVNAKLDQPITPGYCNAGVVLESGVEGLPAGCRVATFIRLNRFTSAT